MPMQQREVVESGVRANLGQVAGTNELEFLGNRDGVGLAHKLVEATEQEHAGQGHDEGRDAYIRCPKALPRADHRAQEQAEEHACPPRQAPVPHGEGNRNAHECCHGTHREVDVTGDDDQDHANCQDQDVGVAVEQVDHVARGQRAAPGEDLEEDDKCHQGEDHAELAGIATK